MREGQRSAAAVCARGRRACVQLPPPATVTPVQRGVKQGRVVSERRAAAADGGAAIAASTRGPALRHCRRRHARHLSATLPSHRTGPHQVLSPTHLLLAAPAYSRPSCNPATSLPVIVLICFSGMPAVNGCRCAHCATLIGSPGHECMYKTSYTVSAEVMPTSALLDPTVALLFAGLVPPCQAVEQRSSTFKCTHHGCSSQGVR